VHSLLINPGLLFTLVECKKVAFLSFKFAQKEKEIYFSFCYLFNPSAITAKTKSK